MLIPRIIPAVFLSLLLFLTQQSGILHVLHHIYTEKTQQQEQPAPHSNACEQCTNYAQFGNTIATNDYVFKLFTPAAINNPLQYTTPGTQYTTAASARGPPVSQSLI